MDQVYPGVCRLIEEDEALHMDWQDVVEDVDRKTRSFYAKEQTDPLAWPDPAKEFARMVRGVVRLLKARSENNNS